MMVTKKWQTTTVGATDFSFHTGAPMPTALLKSKLTTSWGLLEILTADRKKQSEIGFLHCQVDAS